MQKLPKITLIIATYNNVKWLEKVLHGYSTQNYKDFEVIVADDGSSKETEDLIKSFQKDYPVPLHHIWHEDKGYRRQTILNISLTKAAHEYVVFTDGDCIPKEDFLERHANYAEKGKFLSGGYCKLDMDLSEDITKEDILAGNCFDVEWLKEKGSLGSSQYRKLASGETVAKLLDVVTPSNASFNNCNSSAWLEDLIRINGYDERMQYGGPDRELGERLENAGVKGKQIRHRALCLHLDHPRGYKTKESLERNLAIRKNTRKKGYAYTYYGIVKGDDIDL
ncbi:MAG: glycosyltransferase involved in cell wall biosynthesis [Dokdonia sp.]|jgi:glycosyltransferase involved in cell wall biosynthesis